MADLLTVIAVDQSVVHTWQNLIDNIKAHGIKKLVESKAKIATDAGLDNSAVLDLVDDSNDREPWLHSNLRDSFKSVCREQFVLKINGLDPLTQVGAIAFDDDTDFADDWDSLSDKALTEWAMTKGNNAVLRGGVKRGKTNFALMLAEKFLKIGWVVVGNIRVASAPTNYHYASTLSEMLRVICRARLKGQKVLIILDEGGIFWAKIETVYRQARAMAKLVITLGKLDAILLAIHHFQSDTPSILARTAVADFEKTGVKNVYVSIREGTIVRPKLFTSVPPTTLSYRPEEIQMFTVNLPIERMFDAISRIPDGENQWEAMLKIIDELELGQVDDITEKDVALWLRKKRGLSERKIGDTVGTPRGTVHDWIAKGNEQSEGAE